MIGKAANEPSYRASHPFRVQGAETSVSSGKQNAVIHTVCAVFAKFFICTG
jgi:hypothetical protein